MQPHHTTPTKTCTKCGETKPATAEYFHRAKLGLYGLKAVCTDCIKIETQKRYATNPDYNRNYYLANSERIKQNVRSYREADPARKKEMDRDYREKNRERVLRRKRTYAAANREREAERARAWRAANPERHRASVMRRRALKLSAEGSHTGEDIRAQYERQKGRCYWCGEKVKGIYHVDHIVPLSRGGSNWPENFVIACSFCNLSRHNKLPHEWPQGGRLL